MTSSPPLPSTIPIATAGMLGPWPVYVYMNMNIKIEHKNKVGSLPTSHWIDPKKLKNYTLPTFTKRIVRYLESNK